MNILLTSAGRRGYLVNYFKEVLGYEGKVYVANSSPIVASFAYADESVVTPVIYSDEYIPFLFRYCKEKDITVIISLFDADLPVLSKHKKKFEEAGITIVVSDYRVIEICNDKWKTVLFAEQNGIKVPKTYINITAALDALENGQVSFPMIVKPRWGMGSLAIYYAENAIELEVLYNKCQRDIINSYIKYESSVDLENSVIIQEVIDGVEFGLDVINDLNGNFCNCVVRQKMSMRSGETDCAKVIRHPVIEAFGEKLGNTLKHIGNLDVDLFVNETGICLLEMNARFGGGYPFSHLAGVNLPAAIIKWINKQPLSEEIKIKKYNCLVQKDIGFIEIPILPDNRLDYGVIREVNL